MKKRMGMTDFEAGAYVIMGLGWFLLTLFSLLPNDNEDVPDNRPICLVVLIVVTIIAFAIIVKERAWRKKMAEKRFPIPFPKQEMENNDPVTLECIAYFKPGAIVHVTDISPFIGLTPPTLDELLKKSYTDENLPVRYNADAKSFVVPDGFILYITKKLNIEFTQNFGRGQLISEVKYVPGVMGPPVRAITEGQSVDIETLPRIEGLDAVFIESSIIKLIENGKLDAEYDPKTQILLIKSGGLHIDGFGNMRAFRVSDYKIPLEIKIVKSERKSDGEKAMDDALVHKAGFCPSCKHNIPGTGDFCPDCGERVV